MNLIPEKILVGIDLGSTNIKIAGLHQKSESFNFKFCEVIDLIKKYSLKSFSEINDSHYIEELRHLVTKYKLKNKNVRATLPANSAIIHNLNLNSNQTESEIIEKIQEELSQVSIESIEEMRVACHQIEDIDGPENQISLLACGVPNSVVHRYLNILNSCDLRVTLLDLDAISVYNAFYFFFNKTTSLPVTIVHIGSEYTVCVIMLPGSNPFFYVIKQGGNYITSRIMDDLSLTLYNAEKWKKRVYQQRWTNMESYSTSHLSIILSEFANNLVSEVKKCIRYFQSFTGITEIENIYLTGGGAKLELLKNYFNDQFQIETKIWNPLNFIENTSPQQDEIMKEELGVYLTPIIGTLLRGD